MLKVRNNYKTNLTKSITASTTELQIDRAPSPILTLSNSDDHFLLLLTDEAGNFEVIKCVGIIGRIVTVGITLNTPNINGRGYDNTTALVIDKDEDHTLRMVVTSSALDEFLANLAAIDASFIIASTVEAEAGVNDEHVLSSLKGVEMFEAYAPLASQIQAETGTDNISRMSPLREMQGFNSYLEENLPINTAMFFKQKTVPTNWVFDSSYNDMVILNTSTQSEGGSTGGSWTFSGISVNGHAVTLSEFPSHKHGIDVRWHVASTGGTVRNADWGGTPMDIETKAAGSGLAHTHGMASGNTWRPAYSKLISCKYLSPPELDGSFTSIQDDNFNFIGYGAMALSEPYIFVVSYGENSFSVVDISDPNFPVKIATLSLSPYQYMQTVAVAENYAYTIGSDGVNYQLIIIDISTPDTPFIAATLIDSKFDSGSNQIIVHGDYLFTGMYSDFYINTIDISNPLSPSIVASFYSVTAPAIKGVIGFSIQENYLYVAVTPYTGTDCFAIIDISDPLSFAAKGYITNGVVMNSRSLKVSGSIAYLISLYNDLTLIDISDPLDPVLISNTVMHSGTYAKGLDIWGGRYVFMGYSATSQAAIVVDTINPFIPVEINYITNAALEAISNIIYHDGYLFCGCWSSNGQFSSIKVWS